MGRVVGLYRIIAPHSAATHFILLTQNCRSFCSVLLRRSVSLTLHFSLRKILRTHWSAFSPTLTLIKKTVTNVTVFFIVDEVTILEPPYKKILAELGSKCNIYHKLVLTMKLATQEYYNMRMVLGLVSNDTWKMHVKWYN